MRVGVTANLQRFERIVKVAVERGYFRQNVAPVRVNGGKRRMGVVRRIQNSFARVRDSQTFIRINFRVRIVFDGDEF